VIFMWVSPKQIRVDHRSTHESVTALKALLNARRLVGRGFIGKSRHRRATPPEVLHEFELKFRHSAVNKTDSMPDSHPARPYFRACGPHAAPEGTA
jgi:hypothetical protein